MAFCKHPLMPIPAETRRVAESACVGSTAWYLRISRELRKLYSEVDFDELYPDAGQWGIHPYRVFALLILQAIEGFSDRAAADQIRTNIGWKYILAMDLDDDGWDASLFAKHRDRLLKTDAQSFFLDSQLKVLLDQGLLDTSKQRTDSTSISALVKILNRTELILETVRNSIEAVSEVAPEWILGIAKSHWNKRYYLDRPFNYRLPKKDGEKEALAQSAGEDGFYILDCISKAPKSMRKKLDALPEIGILRRVLEEQFHSDDSTKDRRLRNREELSPSAERIVSPHETEARTASKGEQTWSGYKLHTTETCVKGTPNFITDARIEEATKNDSLTLPDILERLKKRKLLPKKLFVDCGYSNMPFFAKVRNDLEIDIMTRLRNGHSWQKSTEGGLDNSRFDVDFQNKKALCPLGIASSSWKEKQDGHIDVGFPAKKCRECPLKERCTKADRRILRVQPEAVFKYQKHIREREKDDDFTREYSLRAGAEALQSEIIRIAGRQSTVRGVAKTTIKYVLTAVAVNFGRLLRWQVRQERRSTPIGKYQLLVGLP